MYRSIFFNFGVNLYFVLYKLSFVRHCIYWIFRIVFYFGRIKIGSLWILPNDLSFLSSMSLNKFYVHVKETIFFCLNCAKNLSNNLIIYKIIIQLSLNLFASIYAKLILLQSLNSKYLNLVLVSTESKTWEALRETSKTLNEIKARSYTYYQCFLHRFLEIKKFRWQ